MKKEELRKFFAQYDIKDFINHNLSAYRISREFVEKLGEDKAPSPTAITNYIKNTLNLKWDKNIHTWISCEKNNLDSTISKKKSSLKNSDNIIISHESTIPEENNHSEEKAASSNQISNDKKTKEKSNTIYRTNKNDAEEKSLPISNIKQNKAYSKNSTNSNTINFKDEDINISEYAEYITALGSEKFSLSLSRFVLELVEQRISKKYNIKRKGNRSRIIQIALTEYLRLTK